MKVDEKQVADSRLAIGNELAALERSDRQGRNQAGNGLHQAELTAVRTRRVVDLVAGDFFFSSRRRHTRSVSGIPAEPLFRSKTTNLTSKEAKMGKVMRHTLGASLNIRHNLSSSKGPKPLQLKLLTTYIPKTSAFTLAFSTSQRLRTTRASARTFFTFRHYITPSARNF